MMGLTNNFVNECYLPRVTGVSAASSGQCGAVALLAA